MTDILVLASQLSLPIKAAWLLWLAWVVIQMAWYRPVSAAVPAHDRQARNRHVVESVDAGVESVASLESLV